MGQKVVGALFAVLGLGIAAAAPVVSLRCERGGLASVQCRSDKKVLGLVPIGHLQVDGVTGAYVSTQEAPGEDASSTYGVQQLVLRTRGGERPLPGFSRREGAKKGTVFVELARFDGVASDIAFLAEQGGTTAEYRSVTWTPLLVGAGFFLFGVLALWPYGGAPSSRKGK